jgi:hypothetical protein
MRRPLVGAISGASLGALASLLVGSVLVMPGLTMVTMPGAVAFGALLGWAIGKFENLRFPKGIGLAFAATLANAPLSGVVDWVLRDPLGIGSDGHSLRGCISISLLGVMMLWWVLVPIAFVVAGVLSIITACVRTAPSLPDPPRSR